MCLYRYCCANSVLFFFSQLYDIIYSERELHQRNVTSLMQESYTGIQAYNKMTTPRYNVGHHLDIKCVLRNSQDESHDHLNFSWISASLGSLSRSGYHAVLDLVEEMAWARIHRSGQSMTHSPVHTVYKLSLAAVIDWPWNESH